MTNDDVRRIEDKVDNVHLILAELKGSLSPTLEKLTEGINDAELVQRDHEGRLRALERFRYSVPSVSILALLIDIALAAYYLTHQH